MDSTALPHSLPYMTDDDPLAAVASRSRGLADRVHARLPRTGTVLVSGTAAAAGALSVVVNLPAGAYASPPTVLANISGFVASAGNFYLRQVDQVTATQFRATVVNIGTGSATIANLPISWVAFPA